METLNQDHDVDMEAPQISTLRQEDSPPPPPRRVKLLVKDTRAPPAQAASSSRKRALEDDELEEEDEEDQLIDDDDVLPSSAVPPVAQPSSAADASTSKRKAPSKRKPRKSEKKIAEEERKSKEKIMQAGAPSLAPTMSWFEVSATKAHQHVGQMGTLDVGHVPLEIVSLDAGAAAPSKPPPKKKAPRKAPAVPRVRAKPGPKPKAALLPVPPEILDTDVISEAGYSVTAASSPVTAHFEGNTPEPEPPYAPPYTNGSLVADEPPINLQDVPLPQYPLPVKPFSVQQPPRINTGFATVIALDRTGAKVRHWRTVNREIRGIAGGRWFTHAWMGEKESPLALAIASGDKQVTIPKLPTMSISAPAPTKVKRAAKNSSLTASAVPSRSSSKMRTIMLAPQSDGGDSDMVAAPGS
ncbi:hypothetical protein C8R46DRAFT_1124740 [Mycena filopes]|nr:hypothetical protein C8R46DRAFT_1124740 [Mycena filopes]